MELVVLYIIEFFFYSAAGWLIESLYCSIGEGRIINRGFLTGPMCPIYGTGALVLTLFLYNPFKGKPLLVFLFGMILCDIVEYLTSLVMEKMFHARWWDYTYEFMNLHGRICLKHTLYWGIASIAFVEVLHPHVDKLLHSFNAQTMLYIAIAVLVIFVIDWINSVRKAADIRQLQDKLHALMDTVSGSFSSIKASIGDTYQTIQQTFESGNEKINNTRNETIEQIQDVLSQFELRFSGKKNKSDEKNKFSNRYLRNNFSMEQYTRKQLERLRKFADDVKANIFENGEMQ